MASSENIGTIRTGLPAAWATFLTWVVAKFGLDLKEEDYAVLMVIVPIVIPVFYRISRAVEAKWPGLGKLIFGTNQQPVYEHDA